MPIHSKQYADGTPRPARGYQSPMQAEEMRRVLGLPKKLPTTGTGYQKVQGYDVRLLSTEEAQQLARMGLRSHNKPHRIVVVCKGCSCHIPFGRLVQHERGCKQLRDNGPVEQPRQMVARFPDGKLMPNPDYRG